MAGVWIYADRIETGRELLTLGRKLADGLGQSLTALLAGEQDLAQDFIARGADEVLLLPPLAEGQPVQDYVPLIAAEAQGADPDIFLIGGNLRGKEMAARIAARLDTGLCSDCTLINLEGQLQMERLMYGGAAVQTLSINSRPQMATIPPGSYQAPEPQTSRQGKVRTLEAPIPSGVQIIERKTSPAGSGDITAAKVIVCAGRGYRKSRRHGHAPGIGRNPGSRTSLHPSHLGRKALDERGILYWPVRQRGKTSPLYRGRRIRPDPARSRDQRSRHHLRHQLR
jgi:electron transfer flavoprotein alpha subunit